LLVGGVVGAMAFQWVTQSVVPSLARPSSGQTLSQAFYLSWTLLASGSLVILLRVVGPVALSRPILTWCLSSTTLSRTLHRRSLGSRFVASAIVAGLAGYLAALVVWPATTVLAHFASVAGFVVIGPALVIVATAEQTHHGDCDSGTARKCGTIVVLTALLIWYLASYGRLTVSLRAAFWAAGLLAIGIVALALGLWRVATNAAASGAIPLAELRRAGDLVDRISLSAVTLTSVSLDIAPRPRPPLRLRAILLRMRWNAAKLALVDARRAMARWRNLVVGVALIPLPGSIVHLIGPSWGCVVLVVLAYVVTAHLARWFFAWNASTSLKFLVPFGDRAVRAALLATPVTGGLIFAVGAVWCAQLPAAWIGSSLIVAVIGVWRRLSVKPSRADFDVLIATPIGTVPVGLTLRLMAGWDVALGGGALSFFLSGGAVLGILVIAVLLFTVWARFRPSRGPGLRRD
jgi:hypothetical protein